MANNPSLAEYLAQAQRGVISSRGLGPAMLGNDFMAKQTTGTFFGSGGDGGTSEGVFTTTYGRKVWHALNNQTRFFNALPRVVWGNVAGWRVRTDRGAGRSRPVTETGNLPTVDISNIATVSSLPRIVSTTFGASVKSVFTAQLEGGIGDVLAMENEHAQLDHVKEINEELLAGSAYLTSAGATTTFTVPAAIAAHFKVGDAVGQYDVSASGHDRTSGSIVSSVNTSTGVVTVATGTTFADGDVAYIYSRAGLTSIDDIVSAASSGSNSGTGRALSLTLLDNAIQKIRENGGEPKLILLGHDQYFNLERLLNSAQRYMGQEEFQVGVGSERTFPGTRTGLVLATYQGIPILPDADVPKSVATNDAVLGSNIYVLDTDYLEIAVAQPTQYVENRDYFAANALVVRGLLYTMAEMRCKNIWTQAKIMDLNA